MAYRMDACPLLLGVYEVLSHQDDGLDAHPGLFLLNPLPSFHMLQGQHPLSRERQETMGCRLRIPRSPGGSSPVGPGIQALEGGLIQGMCWEVLGDTADGARGVERLGSQAPPDKASLSQRQSEETETCSKND